MSDHNKAVSTRTLGKRMAERAYTEMKAYEKRRQEYSAISRDIFGKSYAELSDAQQLHVRNEFFVRDNDHKIETISRELKYGSKISAAAATPAQPETPSPSLQELIFAIEEERRAKMQWARNAYAARAHADKLAKALRETADVRIWGKSSPIFARALAALSDYEAIKRGAQ